MNNEGRRQGKSVEGFTTSGLLVYCIDEPYLDQLECPGWVVDEAKLIHHLSNGRSELVVVTLLLHHVWEQVINQGHEEWLVFICNTKHAV